MSSFARWKEACDRLVAAGQMAPRVWERGCARCGCDLEIRPYFAPFAGSVAPETKTRNVCAVCRVDRVKRWVDLMQQSANEGRELRESHLVGLRPLRGTARLLEHAGLVVYNSEDGAWELTASGASLLRRADAHREEASP